MKDVRSAFRRAMLVVNDCGVEAGIITGVTVNNRLTRCWGKCWHKYDGTHRIEISGRLMSEELDDLALMTTMIHEILHTVKGCNNHGVNWKNAAGKIMAKYPEYNITRCTSSEEKGIDVMETYKYVLKCTKCGALHGSTRMSKSVKHPEFYRCKCKGELIRVK